MKAFYQLQTSFMIMMSLVWMVLFIELEIYFFSIIFAIILCFSMSVLELICGDYINKIENCNFYSPTTIRTNRVLSINYCNFKTNGETALTIDNV